MSPHGYVSYFASFGLIFLSIDPVYASNRRPKQERDVLIANIVTCKAERCSDDIARNEGTADYKLRVLSRIADIDKNRRTTNCWTGFDMQVRQ